MRMYKRLDGKKLGNRQVDVLIKEYEEAKKRELEFDPRKNRLVHGIRNYNMGDMSNVFKGKGTKLA